MAKKRARVVLTSGGLEPVEDGGGGGHSVFAKHFLNAQAESRLGHGTDAKSYRARGMALTWGYPPSRDRIVEVWRLP